MCWNDNVDNCNYIYYWQEFYKGAKQFGYKDYMAGKVNYNNHKQSKNKLWSDICSVAEYGTEYVCLYNIGYIFIQFSLCAFLHMEN